MKERRPPQVCQTKTEGNVTILTFSRITSGFKYFIFAVVRLRDRVTVKSDNRHVVREAADGAFEMTIRSAAKSDSGVYTCRIINEYGTKQCEARLEVKGQLHGWLLPSSLPLFLPPSLLSSLPITFSKISYLMSLCLSAPPVEPGLSVIRPVRDITAKAGETVLFECHAVGPKDTDVDWLADGKLIQPALLNCKMHFDGRKCRLLLNSVHEDDSGTYTCKLSTAKGSDPENVRRKMADADVT